MRGSRVANERGIALAVAVFALVVIGALVAGSFFAGRLEQQTGQNTFYSNQASEAAEAALTQTLGTLTSAQMLAMAAGGAPTTLTSVSLGGSVVATPSVSRLTSSVWLVTALGERQNASGTDLATRSVGQLIRLNELNISVNAGLTAIGKVTVSGNSTVSGYDVTPTQWTAAGVDCPPLDDVAGVRFNGQVTQQGSAVINGDPPRQQDNTLNANNMLGGSSFDQLKAMKTLTLTGNVSGLGPVTTGTPARCDTSVESNWGAPEDKTSACFSYFPIVYHYGDLSISGTGSGQGILLVEGNLNVQGRIDFYGPVIVTGGVNIRGTGSDDVKFYGGVMAQDVTLDDSKLTGNAEVSYSSCAIRRSLQGSATPIPLTERSWVQLYN
jgi:Tfp pilus assembly protein PilX